MIIMTNYDDDKHYYRLLLCRYYDYYMQIIIKAITKISSYSLKPRIQLPLHCDDDANDTVVVVKMT